MSDSGRYAVFLFPQALEALGGTIKPYLRGDGDAGEPYILCEEIDTGGSLFEMAVTLNGTAERPAPIAARVMLPINMVRLVISTESDLPFGFHDRSVPPLT